VLGGFGYLQVKIVPLDRSSYGQTRSVHNLVAEAFIGSKPSKSHRVDHIDRDKLNNSHKNLRWIEHSHNVVRSPDTGDRRYFYEGELWLIKELVTKGILYKIVGKMFKCSTMLVQDVKKGFKNHHIKL